MQVKPKKHKTLPFYRTFLETAVYTERNNLI